MQILAYLIYESKGENHLDRILGGVSMWENKKKKTRFIEFQDMSEVILRQILEDNELVSTGQSL